MTYLDRVAELTDDIRRDMDCSDQISLSVVEEYNKLIFDVMISCTKNWDDEY